MNKWENSLKKDDQGCYCSSSQGLFIFNRHLSFIAAGLLFLFFFLFMTGYFLGKKTMAEYFSDKVHQESFVDNVYTSVLMNDQEQAFDKIGNVHCAEDITCNDAAHQTSKNIISPALEEPSLENGSEGKSTCYYAELIGFVTEKAAQIFVKRLAAKGIETEIKKRISKTVKGRTSYWYQVVTVTYTNKNDLIELVSKIIKEENIKNTNIRMC